VRKDSEKSSRLMFTVSINVLEEDIFSCPESGRSVLIRRWICVFIVCWEIECTKRSLS
jgi:hypothetical protein